MTDAQLIDKLGGTSKLAALLELDRRVVSNWRRRGIPKAWRLVIAYKAVHKRNGSK